MDLQYIKLTEEKLFFTTNHKILFLIYFNIKIFLKITITTSLNRSSSYTLLFL
jgi:hypothetical protein